MTGARAEIEDLVCRLSDHRSRVHDVEKSTDVVEEWVKPELLDMSFSAICPEPPELVGWAVRDRWHLDHWGVRHPPRLARLRWVSPYGIECLLVTAWPPVAWAEHVSCLYPALVVSVHSRDPGTRLYQTVTLRAGQVVRRHDDLVAAPPFPARPEVPSDQHVEALRDAPDAHCIRTAVATLRRGGLGDSTVATLLSGHASVLDEDSLCAILEHPGALLRLQGADHLTNAAVALAVDWLDRELLQRPHVAPPPTDRASFRDWVDAQFTETDKTPMLRDETDMGGPTQDAAIHLVRLLALSGQLRWRGGGGLARRLASRAACFLQPPAGGQYIRHAYTPRGLAAREAFAVRLLSSLVEVPDVPSSVVDQWFLPERCRGSEIQAAIGAHPSATSSLRHRLIECSSLPRDWKVSFIQRIAPTIDPETRRAALECEEPLVRVAMGPYATPAEFRALFYGLRPSPDHALTLLECGTVEQRRSIERDCMLPLLRADDHEVRARAIRALALLAPERPVTPRASRRR